MKRFFSRTETAPAFVYKLYGHGGRFYGCCGKEARCAAEGSGRTAYRGTSTRHLSSGRGGGRLLAADVVGTTGGNAAPGSRSVHPFGHGAAVSKTGEIARQKAARTQSRPSRQSPPDARSHRSASEPSPGSLSALLGSVEALRGNAHALYGRHSRRHQAGGHRTHDPSRLVSPLPENRRAGGSRRPAARHLGQPHVGHDVLASLRLGQHALADRRRFQLPLPNEVDAGRSDADVVSDAGRPLSLVRADCRPKPWRRPCCTPTRPRGVSAARPTGCGALPTAR